MSHCNDPKCPLNRQGVSHENHELIENKPVKNQCNNPRCAMNRMGISHETHDGEKDNDEEKQEEYKIPVEKSQQKEGKMKEFHAKVESDLREKQKRFDTENNSDGIDSFGDAMQELGRQIHGDSPNRLSREKILEERRKRKRRTIEQEAQEEMKRRDLKEQDKTSTKPKIFSHVKSEIPSINQILHDNDPYVTFNLTQDTTCNEIKSRYKELSKNYNASRGSVNRTKEEQERLTRVQSKINIAYNFLRKKHCS